MTGQHWIVVGHQGMSVVDFVWKVESLVLYEGQRTFTCHNLPSSNEVEGSFDVYVWDDTGQLSGE